MTTLLTNLKQKSDKEKAVLATVVAVLITGLLFVTWGYNFAHTGKINNLASSAVGMADAVESANLVENFSNAFEQLKALGGMADGQIVEEVEGTDIQDSVGVKHINVFTNPDAFSDTAPSYGENRADVLY